MHINGVPEWNRSHIRTLRWQLSWHCKFSWSFTFPVQEAQLIRIHRDRSCMCMEGKYVHIYIKLQEEVPGLGTVCDYVLAWRKFCYGGTWQTRFHSFPFVCWSTSPVPSQVWPLLLIGWRLCDMFDIRLFLCFVLSTKYQTYSYRVQHWRLLHHRKTPL